MPHQGPHHAPGQQTSAAADFLAGAAQCADRPDPADHRAHIRNLEAELWLGPSALYGARPQRHPALSDLHRFQSAQGRRAANLTPETSMISQAFLQTNQRRYPKGSPPEPSEPTGSSAPSPSSYAKVSYRGDERLSAEDAPKPAVPPSVS